MTSTSDQLYGSFFIQLFNTLERPVSVEMLPKLGGGSYLLNNRIPVYLKHATARKGPWQFTFLRDHQEMQQLLFDDYGECFTCLVCGRDGVAGMNMSELRQVLDHHFEEQEVISVRRPRGTQYLVKGRDGTLERKVSRRAVFDKIRAALD